MTTINTRAAANLVALFNAAAAAFIDLNAAVKAGNAKAFKPNSVVFADITLEELEGMIAPFAGVDTETAPAAKPARAPKAKPAKEVFAVTRPQNKSVAAAVDQTELKATDVRGEKIGYVNEAGKRKASVAAKVVRREDVRGALLEDGTFCPLVELVPAGAGKRFAFEWQPAAVKEEAPAKAPKAKAAAAKTEKPAKKAAVAKAEPVATESRQVLAGDVRGAKASPIEVSYTWGGKTTYKQVNATKVTNRDGVRVAIAGDLVMGFDKLEWKGKKLVYTGRVSKADFAAI